MVEDLFKVIIVEVMEVFPDDCLCLALPHPLGHR